MAGSCDKSEDGDVVGEADDESLEKGKVALADGGNGGCASDDADCSGDFIVGMVVSFTVGVLIKHHSLTHAI